MSKTYFFSADNASVVFRISRKENGFSATERIFIAGSFNSWLFNQAKKKDWEMIDSGAGEAFLVLEKPANQLRIPGNSGFPEFVFLRLGEDGSMGALSLPESFEGVSFLGNQVLLYPEDNPVEIRLAAAVAGKIKKMADFDLTEPSAVGDISNFRQVPGCKKLFRSYHPYKKSFPQFDTENKRSALVKELIEKNGISSIICLCGNEKAEKEAGETVSDYQALLIEKGNELFIDTSYEAVYFFSAEHGFCSVFTNIVRFILSHPSPFLVHCRLGSDRTGVVCALLASLCGASWDEIAFDYEKTRRIGILQYRDSRLLKYSLEQITGHLIEKGSSLQIGIEAFFIKGGYLTQKEIDSLKAALN